MQFLIEYVKSMLFYQTPVSQISGIPESILVKYPNLQYFEYDMNGIMSAMYVWILNMEVDKRIEINKTEHRYEETQVNSSEVMYIETPYYKNLSYFDILSMATTCKIAYKLWNIYRHKLLHVLRSRHLFVNIDRNNILKFKIEVSHTINHLKYKQIKTYSCGKYTNTSVSRQNIYNITTYIHEEYRAYEDISRVKKIYDDLYECKKYISKNKIITKRDHIIQILNNIYDYTETPGYTFRNDTFYAQEKRLSEWPFSQLSDSPHSRVVKDIQISWLFE